MKHPYMHYLNQYLEFISGHYAEITLTVRKRRLIQLKKLVYDLHKNGKVSSVSPGKLKAEDIANIIGDRKKGGISTDTILDDISFLDGFLKFCGNNAVEKFKIKYPRFVPAAYHKRKECLTDQQFNRIFECAYNVDFSDPFRMRSYALVVFCVSGGLRSLEIRHAKIQNLERTERSYKLWLDFVKGNDTYGQARFVPLLPQSQEFIDRYLELRYHYLRERGIVSDLIIPPLANGIDIMSSNNMRKLKDRVILDVGFDFDLRILRRTYAQFLVDNEVPLDVVQVALGHLNPNTTYRNYAGVRTEKVSDRVFSKLINSEKP